MATGTLSPNEATSGTVRDLVSREICIGRNQNTIAFILPILCEPANDPCRRYAPSYLPCAGLVGLLEKSAIMLPWGSRR